MDRLAFYRRWKLGEHSHDLAKEAGVTRERMRHMLSKMDADPRLAELLRTEGYRAQMNRWRDKALEQADALSIAGMRIAELELALRRLEYYLDADQEILDAMDENERRAHLEMLAIARKALKGNE